LDVISIRLTLTLIHNIAL